MGGQRTRRGLMARLLLVTCAAGLIGLFAPTPAMATCEHNDFVVEYQCPYHPPFTGGSMCVGVGHHGATGSSCLPPANS